MKKFLLILILQNFIQGKSHSQSFNVGDLLTMATLPSKNIQHYMKKKGFELSGSTWDSIAIAARFTPNIKGNKNPDLKKNIEVSIKDNSKYFTLNTSDINEFKEGEKSLIDAGFFYDTRKDLNKESYVFFQKANITINAVAEVKDGATQYHFYLKEKAIPSTVGFAEDLLQFDSHEFLVSYFGEQNVKKDRYYFSEKELKKCSVLFSGTNRQVVFIWQDEINLSKLEYILVSNALPTEGAKNNDPLAGNNEWKLRNGIYPGMTLKELLKLNEADFEIYGNQSELSLLAKPNETGKIDFKKTAVMFACRECGDSKLFDKKEVSAIDAAKADLSMKIFDVAIYPSNDVSDKSIAGNTR